MSRLPSLLRALVVCLSSAAVNATPPELWVYSTANCQVDQSVDDLIALMERSKKAGYSAIVVNDFKFGKMDDRPDHFYRNLERARVAGERIGMEIIPGVMPIGYSGSLLMNNPHLAAGIPVRDCRMLVEDGRAKVLGEANLLPGGGFERADGTRLEGWSWVDGFGKTAFLDGEVKHGGTSSLRMENFKADNPHGNCRVSLKLELRPWQQYQLTFWAKTEDVRGGEIRAMAIGGGKTLSYTHPGVARTQDWKRHDILFNSFEHEEVNVYIGIWGGESGTMWIDDASLRCVAGVNMLRREGCPVRVTSADGGTVFEEGRDFEKWSYPKMGADPWQGSFQVTHPEPPLVLTKDSRIQDGEVLSVSFYHTVLIHDEQVGCCLVHDEVFAHLERQIKLVHQYLKPKTYFMNHDEIRVAGHCEPCRASGRTSGALLADNVRRCTNIIGAVNPAAAVVVWSDMFDPHHNAREDYYLVANTLEGSWDGLTKEVTVVNWNGGKKRESLRFFAERGHRQVVAGFYDDLDVPGRLQEWTDAAAGLKGVDGYIYTTWRKDYSKLEAFAEGVRDRMGGLRGLRIGGHGG